MKTIATSLVNPEFSKLSSWESFSEWVISDELI
jgi:hypothetical protein